MSLNVGHNSLQFLRVESKVVCQMHKIKDYGKILLMQFSRIFDALGDKLFRASFLQCPFLEKRLPGFSHSHLRSCHVSDNAGQSLFSIISIMVF